MKKLTLLCSVLLLALFSSSAVADHHGGKKKSLDFKVSKMQEKLDLSDDQADEIYALMKSSKKNSGCKDLEVFSERKACRKSAREAVDSKINALLTEEQQTEFAAMKAKRAERRANRSPRRR